MNVCEQVRIAFSQVAESDLPSLDPRGYRDGYWALARLFRDHVKLDDRTTVLAGATAVYGWMPTIFRRLEYYDEILPTLRKLCSVRSAVEGLEAAERCQNRDKMLRFVNGSVVGTSKFLHFMNPDSIPIWDSRVARSFGIEGHWRVDNVDHYINYWSGMKGCQALPPKAFEEFCQSPEGQGASRIRLMEYALFLAKKAP